MSVLTIPTNTIPTSPVRNSRSLVGPFEVPARAVGPPRRRMHRTAINIGAPAHRVTSRA